VGSTVHPSVESKTGGSPPGAPWLGGKPVEQAVPEGYLDIPFRCTRRRILRFESGLALDSHLRRLSRLSGAVDRAVALRLGRLRGRAAYVRLGYARFVDYARERVGLAPRTAQELARLGEALPDLPLLDQRLREGRISWTAAVQVERVAGAEDTARWVSLAESLPVRELRQRVKETLQGPLRNGNSPADEPTSDGTNDRTRTGPTKEVAKGGCEDAEGTTGAAKAPHRPEAQAASEDEMDDRLARLQVSVSGRTAQLWDASLELCELVVGGPLAEGEGPEYLFAEFHSGIGPQPRGERHPRHPGVDPRRSSAARCLSSTPPRKSRG
jgi:hypothetical protein